MRWRYHAPAAPAARGERRRQPAAGAIVYYYLKDKPKGDVTLDVLDATGQGRPHAEQQAGAGGLPGRRPGRAGGAEEGGLKAEPGLHRAVWDLRYKGPSASRGRRSTAAVSTKGRWSTRGRTRCG